MYRALRVVGVFAMLLGACTTPVDRPDVAAADVFDVAIRDAVDDIVPDAPATCLVLCSDFATRCAGVVLEEPCLVACAAVTTDAGAVDGAAMRPAARACLVAASMDCAAAARCLRPPPVVPFSAGPYGNGPRDIAGPFTLATTDGNWSFQDEWTGADNYVFLVYAPRTIVFPNRVDYSLDLFAGSVETLLAASPRNTHYFFLWYRDQPQFEEFRASASAEIAGLATDDRTHWTPRVHFVTEAAANVITGWLGDLVRARIRSTAMNKRYEAFQFAIDRTQRVREVGQLGKLASGGLIVDLNFLASEPVYYNFEHAREQRLRATPATVVTLLTDEVVVSETFPEVTLPDAATMAGFDTLEVDLSTNCVNHRDGDCGAWDYISDLRLCDAPPPPLIDAGVSDSATDVGSPDAAPPPPHCDLEIARWITSYWREGRWVTDISGMLPLLRAGGRQRFRWYASRQFDPRPANYIASLSLRFSNRGRPMRPVEAVRVYEGGTLNSMYNTAHPPVRFTVPADVRRVELYSLITGHGSETSQCAEFCNHTHHFAVNGGVDHVSEFPEAQAPDGCRMRVDRGVVPNQHGTWYFGRGGWCPGWDVAPFIADVTPETHIGVENELTYQALIGRVQPAAGRGYGNIDMTTYLVYWR